MATKCPVSPSVHRSQRASVLKTGKKSNFYYDFSCEISALKLNKYLYLIKMGNILRNQWLSFRSLCGFSPKYHNLLEHLFCACTELQRDTGNQQAKGLSKRVTVIVGTVLEVLCSEFVS